MAALALLAPRCAEDPSDSWQDTELQLIKSTIRVHYPNAEPIEPDSSLWIIRHAKASGDGAKSPQDDGYVEFEYHGELLPISQRVVYQTTDSLEARRLGTFTSDKHYAPIFTLYSKDYTQAALYKALGQMHEGDTLTVLSASWHAFSSTGATGVAANTPVIFTVTLKEALANADSAAARELRWVNDYVNTFNGRNANAAQFVPATDTAGTVQAGIYVRYIDTVQRNDTTLCAKTGDVLNVKYSGYYLRDGFLLDSNNGEDAGKAGWSVDTTTSTSTYYPTAYYAHTFSKALLSTTSIKSFDIALLNIAEGSVVEVVFTSDYGYGATGTTTNASRPIYPYTPLRFKIAFVGIQ